MIIDVTARYPLASVWWRGEYRPADVDEIIIHHTMTGELPANASKDDELAVLDCIYTFHVNTRGFGGIGYHGIAFASGRAYLTCPLTRWGAHVALENDHLWGFAAAGDYSNGIPPDGTLRALAELINMASMRPIRPHLAYGGTSCPGARWREWVPKLPDLAREEQDMTPEEAQELIDAAITPLKKDIAALQGTITGVIGSIKNRNKLRRLAADSAKAVAEAVQKLGL